MNEKVAIVGGGILGMTAALRIAEKGYQVELFEPVFSSLLGH